VDANHAIPDGVPADPTVLVEEWLRSLAPAGQGGIESIGLRVRADGPCVVMTGSLPFVDRPWRPDQGGHILLALIGATRAKHDLRPGGDARRMDSEDEDGTLCGYALVHPWEEIPRFTLYNADSVLIGRFPPPEGPHREG